jgi:ethanolamine utilization protein EutA
MRHPDDDKSRDRSEGSDPSLFGPNSSWRTYRYGMWPREAPTQAASDLRLRRNPRGPETITLPPGFIADHIELTSVGLDVGSSTSHLTFTVLVLERPPHASVGHYVVVERRVTYQSAILLTPYLDAGTIDADTLAGFIAHVYEEAGFTPDAVETGALIVTGEAASKANAEAIATLFAEQAGKFVCAAAGPNLEAVMAAHGSGAVRRSRRIHGQGRTVVNVDVGGGSAKLAVCRDGRIEETAAISVGARLVAMDATGRISRIEVPGQIVGDALGIPLIMGQALSPERQRQMAERLADCLFAALHHGPLDQLAQRLLITPSLAYQGAIDAVTFSGGVAEYIYGSEERSFGDLGPLLGAAIAQRVSTFGLPVEAPDERIRATVIGAALHTLQVSSNTVQVSRPSLLPKRNLRIVAPSLPDGQMTMEDVRLAINVAMRRVDVHEGEDPLALSISWRADPSYYQLRALADGIAAALPRTIAQKAPIIVLFDVDIGSSVGHMLSDEVIPGHDVISLDEVEIGELDFVDLGQQLEGGEMVPVVVKSLVFGTQRGESAD